MSTLDRLHRLGPIQLTPGVTPWQAATLLFGAFFSIGLMTFITVGQTYILNEHLGIPAEVQGTLSGDLVFWTEVITLVLFVPAGILVDRVGRRLIFAVGFLLLALTYVLYPMAGSVEDLYLYRILYALGVVTVATALATVMADYPDESSRGKLVAIVGVLSGLGIVVINQFFGGLPKRLTADGMDGIQAGYVTHYIVACIAVVVAVLVWLGLQKGTPIHHEKHPSVRDLFVSGFAQARNPRILLAYLAAFIARGDQAVNATFLILWGNLAAQTSGLDSAAAIKNGTLIFVLAQIAALVWSPIMGPFMDRVDRVTGLALAMALAAVGNLAVIWMVDPTPGSAWFFCVLLGIGQISVYLASQSLVGQEAPLTQRGSVMGAFNVAGAIGILLITAIGGRLFDGVAPYAPFVLVGAINVVLLVLCVAVRLSGPAKRAVVRSRW
ncbi:MFS transporter [Thermochromatium tepidum]|uniref:MFS transporter n=1 Tax=Thermochromatium tepidum ATCC 43061 TaxID=316276 RepID=A0A6I6E4A0_THETI|nr:MFS transporter [Thermochromatium tepidum]QGU32582.1 MFS transporter [Thermochromatium tepidum ATCC 43061]